MAQDGIGAGRFVKGQVTKILQGLLNSRTSSQAGDVREARDGISMGQIHCMLVLSSYPPWTSPLAAGQGLSGAGCFLSLQPDVLY